MGDVAAKEVHEFEQMLAPGDFMWSGRESADQAPTRLVFLCPCGCGAFLGVGVNGDPTKHPVWQWDGNVSSPTITPSIRYLAGCKWHGYLTAGVFSQKK